MGKSDFSRSNPHKRSLSENLKIIAARWNKIVMAKSTPKGRRKAKSFKSGDRVKISTGSKYIESVDNYFGTVLGHTCMKLECVVVQTDEDGTLSIHASRLKRI